MNEYRYDCILASCEKEWNATFMESKGAWHAQTSQTKGEFVQEFCEKLKTREF